MPDSDCGVDARGHHPAAIGGESDGRDPISMATLQDGWVPARSGYGSGWPERQVRLESPRGLKSLFRQRRLAPEVMKAGRQVAWLSYGAQGPEQRLGQQSLAVLGLTGWLLGRGDPGGHSLPAADSFQHALACRHPGRVSQDNRVADPTGRRGVQEANDRVAPSRRQFLDGVAQAPARRIHIGSTRIDRQQVVAMRPPGGLIRAGQEPHRMTGEEDYDHVAWLGSLCQPLASSPIQIGLGRAPILGLAGRSPESERRQVAIAQEQDVIRSPACRIDQPLGQRGRVRGGSPAAGESQNLLVLLDPDQHGPQLRSSSWVRRLLTHGRRRCKERQGQQQWPCKSWNRQSPCFHGEDSLKFTVSDPPALPRRSVTSTSSTTRKPTSGNASSFLPFHARSWASLRYVTRAYSPG